MRTRILLATTVLVTGLFATTTAPSAGAKDGDVRRSGNCSASSNWKLKLSPENGSLEVEFEVDQNVVGDKWRVTMKHDGVRFFRGTRTTKAPSGSFEVRRVVTDHAGSDRIVARARNLSTDEVCRGRASI